MQVGYAPKVHYRITYWKNITAGQGTTLTIFPKNIYEYNADDPYKDKLVDFLKENDISYEIVEIQERLIEKGE